MPCVREQDRREADGVASDPHLHGGQLHCLRRPARAGGAASSRWPRRDSTSKARICEVGCLGPCSGGPVVVVGDVFYEHLRWQDCAEIVREHLGKGVVVDRLTHRRPDGRHVSRLNEIDFFRRQTKIVLGRCGRIDPQQIDDYIGEDGYQALAKVLSDRSPESVLNELRVSGLRGRGGAGFPTWRKWDFTRKAAGDAKYVVCNADEGDPGAFMDRSILEGDPHAVIEGMAIAALTIGACRGFIYVRAEYPLAVERLKVALSQARERGLLGSNILGTGFQFDVELRMGSGAFVCGEETALLTSIEGNRGEPRPRPPFPAQRGLWGKPTLLNNVETYANVPTILLRGGAEYAQHGTHKSRGTKVFALAGAIKNSGLVEVPIGMSLGDLIYDIGGGIPVGKEFKAAQIGGPSGGCIPKQHLAVPLDYESLSELGAIMGSGGLIVMDEDSCMVDVARFFLEFVQEESCGKCVPCRVGTKRMLEILERICAGKGEEADVERLIQLGESIKESSLCGLGQTAPNPVLSTIRHFGHEYVEHIRDRHCHAGVCPDLVYAPCSSACPANVDIPGYISLVAEDRCAEALQLHRERNPFPAICSRVCFHTCEDKCRRADVGRTGVDPRREAFHGRPGSHDSTAGGARESGKRPPQDRHHWRWAGWLVVRLFPGAAGISTQSVRSRAAPGRHAGPGDSRLSSAPRNCGPRGPHDREHGCRDPDRYAAGPQLLPEILAGRGVRSRVPGCRCPDRTRPGNPRRSGRRDHGRAQLPAHLQPARIGEGGSSGSW